MALTDMPPAFISGIQANVPGGQPARHQGLVELFNIRELQARLQEQTTKIPASGIAKFAQRFFSDNLNEVRAAVRQITNPQNIDLCLSDSTVSLSEYFARKIWAQNRLLRAGQTNLTKAKLEHHMNNPEVAVDDEPSMMEEAPTYKFELAAMGAIVLAPLLQEEDDSLQDDSSVEDSDEDDVELARPLLKPLYPGYLSVFDAQGALAGLSPTALAQLSNPALSADQIEALIPARITANRNDIAKLAHAENQVRACIHKDDRRDRKIFKTNIDRYIAVFFANPFAKYHGKTFVDTRYHAALERRNAGILWKDFFLTQWTLAIVGISSEDGTAADFIDSLCDANKSLDALTAQIRINLEGKTLPPAVFNLFAGTAWVDEEISTLDELAAAVAMGIYVDNQMRAYFQSHPDHVYDLNPVHFREVFMGCVALALRGDDIDAYLDAHINADEGAAARAERERLAAEKARHLEANAQVIKAACPHLYAALCNVLGEDFVSDAANRDDILEFNQFLCTAIYDSRTGGPIVAAIRDGRKSNVAPWADFIRDFKTQMHSALDEDRDRYAIALLDRLVPAAPGIDSIFTPMSDTDCIRMIASELKRHPVAQHKGPEAAVIGMQKLAVKEIKRLKYRDLLDKKRRRTVTKMVHMARHDEPFWRGTPPTISSETAGRLGITDAASHQAKREDIDRGLLHVSACLKALDTLAVATDAALEVLTQHQDQPGYRKQREEHIVSLTKEKQRVDAVKQSLQALQRQLLVLQQFLAPTQSSDEQYSYADFCAAVKPDAINAKLHEWGSQVRPMRKSGRGIDDSVTLGFDRADRVTETAVSSEARQRMSQVSEGEVRLHGVKGKIENSNIMAFTETAIGCQSQSDLTGLRETDIGVLADKIARQYAESYRRHNPTVSKAGPKIKLEADSNKPEAVQLAVEVGKRLYAIFKDELGVHTRKNFYAMLKTKGIPEPKHWGIDKSTEAQFKALKDAASATKAEPVEATIFNEPPSAAPVA